jgi:methionyl-tRNA formyltransferase
VGVVQILAFIDKWIGRECALDMVRKFPEDSYTFVVGPHEQAETCQALQGHDVRRNSPEVIAALRAEGPAAYDWLLNLWGHDIFRAEDLALAKRSLNIHPGLLPHVRGSDPVVWTLRKQLPAGATLHELTLDVDAGPIWAQVTVPYKLPITGGALYEKVVRESVLLFKARWRDIRNSPYPPAPQQGEHPTYRRKQLDPDRRIPLDETISKLLAHDFNDGYRAIVNVNGVDYHARLTLTPVKP